jgi:hypothetical protein
MGVDAMHLSSYARSRGDVPDLMDLVARTEMEGDEEEEEARRLLGKWEGARIRGLGSVLKKWRRAVE